MSLRVWLTITVLTGVAIGVVLVPPSGVSDAVIYALLIADFAAIGLIARDARALWAAVAFAASCCVAWYVDFFSTHADDGLLDGLILAVIALVAAGAAAEAGVLVGRVSGGRPAGPRAHEAGGTPDAQSRDVPPS